MNDSDDEIEDGFTNNDDENESSNNNGLGNSGVQAEVGIIEKIRLQNFMCHKHLEIRMGPNINFLVGQNGSGKSAVLVAITICLGAKTTFTNRGKLHELILSGKK